MVLGLMTVTPEFVVAAETKAPVTEGVQPEEEVVDKFQKVVSTKVLDTARWVDSFFYDNRFEEEDNKTRVKLIFSTFSEKGESTNAKLKVRLRASLPNTKKKGMLIIGGDDEDGIGFSSDGGLGGSINSDDEENFTVGFKYFFKSLETRNISGTVNFRYRNSEIVYIPEARWREAIPMDPFLMRLTQRFRWYSDTGWESTSTIDFDRKFGSQYFFRASTQGDWSEEEEDMGFRYGFSVSLVNSLGKKDRALVYESGIHFQTDPSHKMSTAIILVRYRQQFWRKWLFFEVAPQVVFPEEDDYEWKPGITFQIEGVFGRVPLMEATDW